MRGTAERHRYEFTVDGTTTEGLPRDTPADPYRPGAEKDGEIRTIVAPVTHSPPRDAAGSMELPAGVCRSLGLDGGRHWVRLDELNRFTWPGYDLRPIPGRGGYAYGMLPSPVFEEMRRRIVELARKGRGRTQSRD